MQTQPEITEDSSYSFYSVLDQVEIYDQLLSEMNTIHTNAMLSLASLKFTDPFILNVNALRCLPAFCKVDEAHNLHFGYGNFMNKAKEGQFEFQQDCEIEEACSSKMGIETVNTELKEREVIHRFNIATKENESLRTAEQFQLLLRKILEIARARGNILKRFER